MTTRLPRVPPLHAGTTALTGGSTGLAPAAATAAGEADKGRLVTGRTETDPDVLTGLPRDVRPAGPASREPRPSGRRRWIARSR